MQTPFSLRMLAAGIFLLSFLNASGQANEVIWVTTVPEWGNASATLYGKVNANPQAYRVAGLIFIEEAGGWWPGSVLHQAADRPGPQQLPGSGFQRGRRFTGGFSQSSLCHRREAPWR